jgi:hypothetical protein
MLFAQSDRATITGTVKDASSAVLPGVQVRVINVGTNDVYTVTTDTLGLFQVSNLPIGNYAVNFSKDGFKTLDRKGITLLIGQVAEINAALQVGTRAEIIEVTAEAPVLQTETANLTTNLDSQAVSELPMNVTGGRMLSTFMFNYVPGVEGTDYSSHINGSLALNKEVLIDGVSAVSQLGGYISESQPPMEGVQEFQVETAGISADGGRTGGGIFRYEMKSGSNNWHGSAFGFMHDASLDALSANDKLLAQQQPQNAAVYLRKSESLSDWGVSGGGPILKNKLFFYSAFERYMQSNYNLGAPGSSVPTDTMMGLNADGSVGTYADLSAAVTAPIYNPVDGTVFAGNKIPTTMISPVTAKILQLYHKYYAPEVVGQAQNNAMPASTLPWNHINETSLKLDYNVSDKHRISATFFYNFYPRILADQGGIWSPTAVDGGPFANSYEHDTKAPSFRIADSYNISPTVLNTFHFAVNRFRNPSIAKSQSGGWNSILGLGDGVGNFPKISFNNAGWYGNCCLANNGWNFGGLGSQFNDFYAANTFIFNDDVSWVKGRNAYKFGAEFRAMQFNSHGDQGVYSVTFDPLSTGGGNYNAGGNALASFLLGDASQGGLSTQDWTYGRRKSLSLYVADNIKVTSKLTVNLDLRWDYNNPYKEKNGNWSNFNIQEMNTVTGLPGTMDYLGNGSKSFEKRQDWTNFAPHVGAAYALTQKTVIRGTFSVFYVPLNMNNWAGIPYGFNPGFHNSNAATAFNWNNGYVGNVTNVRTPDYTQWGMVYVDPRALTLGNTQQWTIGVQRELTKDLKIDVSYVQSASYHLQSGTLETNQPTVANMQRALPNEYNSALWSPTYLASKRPYDGLIYNGNLAIATVPYPQAQVDYGPLFSVNAPLGNSTYKGLQFSVTKRASHGLSLQGSYVYSKTHGDVDSSLNDLWWAGSLQNVYDLKDEAKNISDFDMTHVVKGYFIYDLPFGKNKLLGSGVGPIMNDVIGGWSVNFGYHYNTGTPMQIHSTNGYPGFNSVYVDLVPGCKLTNGSPSLGKQYVNTTCFQNPANGQLGTAGNFLDGLRNPGMATEDMSVHKATGFGPEERYKLTLRLEFFNVFNRHQAGSAVTNMSDPNFGRVINYGGLGGRVGQFGARFTF